LRERSSGVFLELCGINGQWRMRNNFELYNLYDKPDLVKYIKINRLKWAGHVIRVDNNRVTKRMFNTRPEGKKKELEDLN
jgi:hypothetical protein